MKLMVDRRYTKGKKYNKHKTKRTKRVHKSMKGGELSQEEQENLRGLGFQDDEIDRLNQLNIPMNIINQAITYYHENSHQLIINIAQGLNENANEVMGQDINNEAMAPLDLADLQGDGVPDDDNVLANIPQNQDDEHNIDLDESGNTSFADESFGGKRRSKKRRHLKKHKSHRRIKGGAVYGNGYGSNCNEPNYNIYNTNLLKLFPYSAK